MNRYTMKELPDLERPYEKLETYGEKELSNAELLAIILKTGTKEETALQLAQRILNECDMKSNGLSLKNISLNKLMEIKGIGRVKAILLKAVFELGNRMNSEIVHKPFLADSNIAGEYLARELKYDKQEKMYVLGLSVKGKLERQEVVSIGKLNEVNITPIEVFRLPIECGCYDFIICHNHPSGDPTPSREDLIFTENIKGIGKILGIHLIDHIIVGNEKYFSIRQSNLVKW